MNALNNNNLPVAPEFVSTLQESAFNTITDCLKKLDAPQVVIDLAQDIWSLGYYMQMCAENPACLTGDVPTFDGANAVIDTINHMAAVGATFEGAYSKTFPRKGTLLAESEAEKIKIEKGE